MENTAAMLKLTDLRKTTRRARTDGRRVVYPHFLRDRTQAPRIELAARYLEGMVGRPRRDLDEEVVVQLFGDHKLARCIVACLAASYRHHAQTFAEVLPPEQVTALAERGMLVPSDLRLWLYARANTVLPGFVGGPERPPFLRQAAVELGLSPEQIERLVTLDAPANAILVRTGPTPTADDIIARFNYETASALLANATLVRVTLGGAPSDPAATRALCVAMDVRAELTRRELVLHGQQDALNGWARHGARLAHLFALLLGCGLPVRSGEAIVAAPGGGEWVFRLDAEALAHLGAPTTTGRDADFDAQTLLAAWRAAPALAANLAALRRQGSHEGWALRRATGPLVAAGGVIPAVFSCARGAQRVALVPNPATSAGAARLAALAGRVPLAIWDASATLGEGPAGSAPRGSAPMPRLAGPADVERLPSLLASAADKAERHADAARIEAVFAEVGAAGVLTEARVAERLGCAEDDVPARLGESSVRAVREARDIRYVEGFGLCSLEVLVRAREAADEVVRLRAGQPVGAAWTARVLGRRLREVTGASEGIECLIAFLGAA
jgi:hypothetical protein